MKLYCYSSLYHMSLVIIFPFSFHNVVISHLLMLLKTEEMFQHAMLQESMEPSMVLDRTMFNLYCSTTWLDQAQRKIPLTGRVSVKQPPKREERWEEVAWRSTSWRFHCELLSISPMHKGAEVQEVKFIATKAKINVHCTVSVEEQLLDIFGGETVTNYIERFTADS